jgi:hypothetical protein
VALGLSSRVRTGQPWALPAAPVVEIQRKVPGAPRLGNAGRSSAFSPDRDTVLGRSKRSRHESGKPFLHPSRPSSHHAAGYGGNPPARRKLRAAHRFPGSHGPRSRYPEEVTRTLTGHAWARPGGPDWMSGRAESIRGMTTRRGEATGRDQWSKSDGWYPARSPLPDRRAAGRDPPPANRRLSVAGPLFGLQRSKRAECSI